MSNKDNIEKELDKEIEKMRRKKEDDEGGFGEAVKELTKKANADDLERK